MEKFKAPEKKLIKKVESIEEKEGDKLKEFLERGEFDSLKEAREQAIFVADEHMIRQKVKERDFARHSLYAISLDKKPKDEKSIIDSFVVKKGDPGVIREELVGKTIYIYKYREPMEPGPYMLPDSYKRGKGQGNKYKEYK